MPTQYGGSTSPLVETDGSGGHKAATSVYGKGAAAGDTALLVATAANQTAAAPAGVQLVVAPAGWAVVHAPAAATQATASKAAGGAGVRHVCRAVTATIACGATAQTPLTVNLRDGATGAGTVLAAWTLAAPVDGCAILQLEGLNLVGSANTAMTLEFSGAGVTASLEAVTLIGYDVS